MGLKSKEIGKSKISGFSRGRMLEVAMRRMRRGTRIHHDRGSRMRLLLADEDVRRFFQSSVDVAPGIVVHGCAYTIRS